MSFFLLTPDSKFRRAGLLIPGSRIESVAKNIFSQDFLFMDFGVAFYRFLDGFGADFPFFATLETSLKVDGLLVV